MGNIGQVTSRIATHSTDGQAAFPVIPQSCCGIFKWEAVIEGAALSVIAAWHKWGFLGTHTVSNVMSLQSFAVVDVSDEVLFIYDAE